jgi:UMF1 family MFS transporter
MSTSSTATPRSIYPKDKNEYQKRIRAWSLYDWANSAFATTILAALLPAYYSSVAGATLPDEATATAYWSITLSVSLLITALLSPILGTISDVVRGKKKFLALFIGIGVIGTGLLVFVSTGDWFLASMCMIIGRVGFGGSIIFYDALLPHVAKEEDRDKVSTQGFALGYLGGGILLAINVAMFQLIPDTLFDFAGIRLSFLSVAIWWAVFSIPILRTVPEPQSATEDLQPGESVVGVSFQRLRETFRDLRHYGELFKYLIAFLIYNDAIGTIIGLAVIYGAELGFETLELVLALLLVQFVGIPFTWIFGNLPVASDHDKRHYFLAFVLFNAIALPSAGVFAARYLPQDVTGFQPEPYVTQNAYRGEGTYPITGDAVTLSEEWQPLTIDPADQVSDDVFGQMTLLFSPPESETYVVTDSTNAEATFQFNGQRVEIAYETRPDGGVLAVLLDGEPLTETITTENGSEVQQPVTIDTYSEQVRYNVQTVITAPEPGQHTLTLVNTGELRIESEGSTTAIARLQVLPPARSSSLPTIFGILMAVQAVGAVFTLIFGRFFKPLANRIDTRRAILLSLMIYAVISVWGYFLNATVEFWFLAWMVAIVQGGSQALSRSLYSSLCPSSKSGEFFGLFSIMSKFASIVGPLLFAGAVALFGSSRPAILSLVVLFALGGFLLMRVNIEKGQQIARAEDARVYGEA